MWCNATVTNKDPANYCRRAMWCNATVTNKDPANYCRRAMWCNATVTNKDPANYCRRAMWCNATVTNKDPANYCRRAMWCNATITTKTQRTIAGGQCGVMRPSQRRPSELLQEGNVVLCDRHNEDPANYCRRAMWCNATVTTKTQRTITGGQCGVMRPSQRRPSELLQEGNVV